NWQRSTAGSGTVIVIVALPANAPGGMRSWNRPLDTVPPRKPSIVTAPPPGPEELEAPTAPLATRRNPGPSETGLTNGAVGECEQPHDASRAIARQAAMPRWAALRMFRDLRESSRPWGTSAATSGRIGRARSGNWNHFQRRERAASCPAA